MLPMADSNPTDCGEFGPTDPVARRREAERAVLTFLIDEHPSQLMVAEVSGRSTPARPIREEDAVERAIRELVGAGLLCCQGAFLVPTRAALYFARLGGGLMGGRSRGDSARTSAGHAGGPTLPGTARLARSLHRTEIGLLERGARVPRIDTLIKIASGLGIRIHCELLDGIGWTPATTEAGAFRIKSRA